MKFLLINQDTERLQFRKLENSDFEIWKDLFEDDTTTKLLGMDEFKTPEERCAKWFEWTFYRYENNLGGQNILVSKEHDKIIGQSGLLVREVNNSFELEIAYSILPQYRMQGFAYEAAKKCKDFAFENNFHDRLVSMIFSENESSKKVALKNGMQLNRKVIFNHKEMELFQINQKEWRISRSFT